MRVLVTLPPELWERVCAVARAQYREPRKQLELIVHQALAEALESKGDLAHHQESVHAQAE
jgi:hypothetical protein